MFSVQNSSHVIPKCWLLVFFSIILSSLSCYFFFLQICSPSHWQFKQEKRRIPFTMEVFFSNCAWWSVSQKPPLFQHSGIQIQLDHEHERPKNKTSLWKQPFMKWLIFRYLDKKRNQLAIKKLKKLNVWKDSTAKTTSVEKIFSIISFKWLLTWWFKLKVS